MSIVNFEDTLGCLDLVTLGEGRYTAPNIPMPYHRVFGGQLLAQLIAVASHSCEGRIALWRKRVAVYGICDVQQRASLSRLILTHLCTRSSTWSTCGKLCQNGQTSE